ncbi:MAG TPA: TetR/AcrR family transcriptional regulator [Albitalea sp.]|uniref:TetR/AcrR family transcriptional regulator n=1 Tax=Piscinibacter sp. TaxID=1903157 RepID=UPI002ED3D208
MPRPARFDDEQIVAATARVAAARGPAGATVARIAAALRAPTGSIYHRFASRDVLLGEVWLRAAESFQAGFAQCLGADDARAAGLAAVRYVPQQVRDRPQEARILLLHRREDFLERGWPAAMKSRAKALSRQMDDGVQAFCQRLFGRSDAVTLRIAFYALAEAPLAAVRRHVQAKEPPPPTVDALIEATYFASIALAGDKP